MGIRKPPAARRRRRAPRLPHYPSWGSKTRMPGSPTKSAHSPHYPSWGSKTGSSRSSVPSGSPNVLITPHGDRKLAAVRELALITPHGANAKPPAGAPDAFASMIPHYPSWGSKTSDEVVVGQIVELELITPHGDRKPTESCAAGPLTYRPHYPSWGSKTPAEACRSTRLDPGRLITPHGDRKRHGARYKTAPGGVHLITPHGDRKQTRTARNWMARRRPASSLPLMGIENMPLCARYLDLTSVKTHYPSWGSKTHRAVPGPPADGRPHYPSWGSKTLHHERRDLRLPQLITPHGDRKLAQGITLTQ